jgi:hypothetical protein
MAMQKCRNVSSCIALLYHRLADKRSRASTSLAVRPFRRSASGSTVPVKAIFPSNSLEQDDAGRGRLHDF